ncbi:hypothetical protein ACTJKP_18600 [Brucella sp. 22210]
MLISAIIGEILASIIAITAIRSEYQKRVEAMLFHELAGLVPTISTLLLIGCLTCAKIGHCTFLPFLMSVKNITIAFLINSKML